MKYIEIQHKLYLLYTVQTLNLSEITLARVNNKN